MVAQLQAGQEIDRYRIEWVLGEGGMASVFRVRHTTLNTTHALKVLSISTRDIRQRLIQEGQMQATLQHPNIVSVSDVLDVSGVPGLLMEYIEGPSLDQWTYRYRPALHESLALFRGIVAGVAHAHNAGLIHRDIKPGNVLLQVSPEGVVPKVTDFGLAKFAQVADAPKRTKPGTTMGTPQYMSPEQMRDASTVDHRADLFSLGCILYELICGVPPFQGDDLVDLINLVCRGEYVPIPHRVKGVPGEVITTVKGLLQPDPDKRIRSCEDILERLQPKKSWLQINDAGGLMDYSLDQLMDGGADTLSLDGPGADAITKLIVENRDRTIPIDEKESWRDSLDDIAPIQEEPAQTKHSQHKLNRNMVWTATLMMALFAAIIGAGLASFGVAALFVTLKEEGQVSKPESIEETMEAVEPGSNPTTSVSTIPMSVPDADVPSPEPSTSPVSPEVAGSGERIPNAPVRESSAPEPIENLGLIENNVGSIANPSTPKPVEKGVESVAPVQPISKFAPPAEHIPGSNFTYTGASSVVLAAKDGTRFAAGGHIPIGRYEIWARFPGTAEVHAGQVTVVDGQRIELRCVDVLLQCRVK